MSEGDPAAGGTAARAGNRVIGEDSNTTTGDPAPSLDVVACFACLTFSIPTTFTGRRVPRSPVRASEKIGERPRLFTLRPQSRFAPPVITATPSGSRARQRIEWHIGMFAKIPAV
jgi:hypothetical protein